MWTCGYDSKLNTFKCNTSTRHFVCPINFLLEKYYTYIFTNKKFSKNWKWFLVPILHAGFTVLLLLKAKVDVKNSFQIFWSCSQSIFDFLKLRDSMKFSFPFSALAVIAEKIKSYWETRSQMLHFTEILLHFLIFTTFPP